MAKLLVRSQDRPKFEVELCDNLSIGRSAHNQIVLDDAKVSRQHAEIRRVEGNYYRLSDLASSNGTWVNGQRLTVPKDLKDGDIIEIGSVKMQFIDLECGVCNKMTMSPGTIQSLRNVTAVILVADIRKFSTMTEILPKDEFSRFISSWFRECTDIIEKNKGTIDKFIGDAVMAYWAVESRTEPGRQVNSALSAAQELIKRAEFFSKQLSNQFPGNLFRIGIGLNLGEAVLGNVGTGKVQSFTVVGDCVNVAFRLEALTKEKNSAVLCSKCIADRASPHFRFRALDEVEVKGRKEPVFIYALELEPTTEV